MKIIKMLFFFLLIIITPINTLASSDYKVVMTYHLLLLSIGIINAVRNI